MYVVVEIWTPKPAFHSADEATRSALFAGIREAIKQLAGIGVVTLGWGAADQDVAYASPHQWFAVWQAPSRELAAAFLAGVEQSGWYTYFEQTNLAGELRDAETVIADHVALTEAVR
ncbi:hypothetical protein FB565_006707 [Actinoplanes lutulentus]|uniref:Uncharacterized protein n=1 Tax=Actinoplanes lutulentus TaxID=1287878 RepID=A0A327Z484_9ACTN|nr:DUF6616 family protein [Actinoplanes lutulentus]MBB2946939.1 hypothetical protein [Actinoplanes lutulentus]RAK30441.1 hypothetical protein B0I29_116100 [Actinoplanes lutulentus]